MQGLTYSAETPDYLQGHLAPDTQLFAYVRSLIARIRFRILEVHNLVNQTDGKVVSLTRVERSAD